MWQTQRSKFFCQPSAQTHNYQISLVWMKYYLGLNVDEHNLLITIHFMHFMYRMHKNNNIIN